MSLIKGKINKKYVPIQILQTFINFVEIILFILTKNNKVIYGGRDIGISGVSAIVKRLTLNEDIPVIIQADEGASHGVFSRVYGEAKLAGAKSINFSTKR